MDFYQLGNGVVILHWQRQIVNPEVVQASMEAFVELSVVSDDDDTIVIIKSIIDSGRRSLRIVDVMIVVQDQFDAVAVAFKIEIVPMAIRD